MKIHWMNLSHDVQLALGSAHYNPNALVLALERDLQPLACWMAREGDAVVVSEARLEVCRAWSKCVGKGGVEWVDDQGLPVGEVVPWGWDRAMVRRLRAAWGGGSSVQQLLPSESQLEHVRRLSSRSFAVSVLRALHQQLPHWPLTGESQFAADEGQLVAALAQYGGWAVMKAPWSSSGRGLRFVTGRPTAAQQRWAQRLLQMQGGVEVEPLYDKVADWAMEFHSDPRGHVAFTGLSRFLTDAHGAYAGNLVAPQEVLRQQWEAHFPLQILSNLTDVLAQVLAAHLEDQYEGPLGVDMMVCRGEKAGQWLLHPCVEVNLRQTMGQLALHLAPLLAQRVTARMEIRQAPNGKALSQQLAAFGPAEYDHLSRLQGGAMPLTPILPDSRFAALLVVG